MPDKKELSLSGIPRNVFMDHIKNPVRRVMVINPLNVLESPKSLLLPTLRLKSTGFVNEGKRSFLIMKK